jgi:hypothetical protein
MPRREVAAEIAVLIAYFAVGLVVRALAGIRETMGRSGTAWS